MLRAEVSPYKLKFAFVAHTSRETFTEKTTYFVNIFDTDNPSCKSIGEVAAFPSLQPSFTDSKSFEEQLQTVCNDINDYASGKTLPENSAIRFGIETALNSLIHDDGTVFGRRAVDSIANGIRINGLVWMNDYPTMERQIGEKLDEGFRCLKLKIGALDFEMETKLIDTVRRTFSSSELEIRVDANGAFNDRDVMGRLDTLSRFDLHSIEQPVQRDSSSMSEICKYSPIPIALDEDMIERWWDEARMTDWLCSINPAYIVLKPSLAGGFEMADKWIKVADKSGIGWWATSALESNIGLSAIAQWLGTHPENLDALPHGLGTGQIYTNNIDAPIERRGERLFITL